MRNLNDLARAIAAREGKTRNQNIGELKEFLRCLGDVLRSLPLADALRLCGLIIRRKS